MSQKMIKDSSENRKIARKFWAVSLIKYMEAGFFKVFGILQKMYIRNRFKGSLLKSLCVFGSH